MPKRSTTTDPILIALRVFKKSVRGSTTKSPPKNPSAVALGKLGGKKGGPARAALLSPARCAEIAKAAAKARWSKEK
jgi:hypothetical protein